MSSPLQWLIPTLFFKILQIAVMTVTLFPIRLLLAAFMMLLAWPIAFLAAWGRIEKEPDKPTNLWKKWVNNIIILFILRH